MGVLSSLLWQSISARKPYNPVMGETFHCSWKVPGTGDSGSQVTFVAEQVSHHPPVSAFYVECMEKQMYLEASLGIKSNLMGNYVGMQFLGEVELHLPRLKEVYAITLPTLYWRSLLSQPYIELNGRVTVTCGDVVAPIIFHPKPFYGGKLHSISGEMKSSTGEVFCKVSGEWDSTLEFQYADGRVTTCDVQGRRRCRKRCRPPDLQDRYDSRRLWLPVTQALRMGDLQLASNHKCQIEDRQREAAKASSLDGTSHPQDAKLFQPDCNNVWRYKYPLNGCS